MPAERATIVACLTPAGRGAVATIAVAGPAALGIVDRLFLPNSGDGFARETCGRIRVGHWESSTGEEVVACRTADDAVEIHCHGGTAAVAAIVDSMIAQGTTRIDWRTWIANAANHAIRAEAWIALSHATTQRAAGVLLDQYQGALDRELLAVRAQIASGSLEPARERTQALLDRANFGLHLVEPYRVVLSGPPNVGKSSLLNAVVGYQRAIVLDQPGTTRDVVTAPAAIGGWPVEMSDTAGIRESSESLERAGIAQTQRAAAEADLLVLCFALDAPISEADQRLIRDFSAALVIGTKADLARPDSSRNQQRFTVMTSAVTGLGISDLLAEIENRLVPEAPRIGAAVPFTVRQVLALQNLLAGLEKGNLATALEALEHVAGTAY